MGGKLSNNEWVASDEDYPDHSKYLWHLTKSKQPISITSGAGHGFNSPFGTSERNMQQLGTADKRLVSILSQHPEPTIWRSQLHYMLNKFHYLESQIMAVCFTECIPHSLPIHAKRFRRYGLLFTKETAYKKGARPVWYLEKELLNRFAKAKKDKDRGAKDPLPFPEELLHLLMLYVPKGGDQTLNGRFLDFTVEREWRSGSDFHFTIQDVAAIIVPNEEDIALLVDKVTLIKNCKFVPVSSIESDNLEHKDFDHYFV